jgi:hypothetical protein
MFFFFNIVNFAYFAVPLTVLPEWVAECIEAVTTVYLQQVKELMETAKQMDSALQRRSKLRSTNTAAGGAAVADKPVLGDSEKISLQIYLDVLAFGEEVRGFDLQPEELTAYRGLLEEVAEARLLTAK